ncbi:HD superfamily phosphodieaserase, includes HD domain of RNase Y [Desulfonauticus submarinus]|uniref:HD superfamily phosphodieaserase, includes HD domain of RNase Y n=1 Tax=Desulfonauticus submarinus TaxID=206665 RepID=A0A1H0G288_9BACT|nr:HD domain-containing protein [Desulfonauticus submarinus]SDO01005.1 HD superfamily phosphodieaserase, includes HD domain of RNase Y [Desulfonauticus submarinus]
MSISLDIEPYFSWFKEYVKNFYFDNPKDQENIRLKEDHSVRVFKHAKSISLNEGFGKEIKFCIELASLFHDIGRFEQYKQYKTFQDKLSVNHALLGFKVLSQQDFWRKLPIKIRRYVGISILLHNRLNIPSTFNKSLGLVVKAVRDADKLDIFKVILKYFENGSNNKVVMLNLSDAPLVTKTVLDDLKQKRLVDYNKMQYINDFKLLLASWIYDFNFKYSYQVILENDYLGKIFSLLPNNTELKIIYRELNDYLKSNVE